MGTGTLDFVDTGQQTGSPATSGTGGSTWGGRENFNNWDEGRNALIQFLNDLKKLMRFLVDHRIPADSRALFTECLADADAEIDAVIAQITQIKTEQHPTYKALQTAGLTGKSLRLKLREFYRFNQNESGGSCTQHGRYDPG